LLGLRYIGVRTRPVRGLLPRPRVAHDRPVRHGRRRWPAAARRVGGRSRRDDRWIRIRSIIESAREGGRKARARGRCDRSISVATSRRREDGAGDASSTHRRRGARQTRARALGAEDNPVHACVVRISPPVARRRGIARRSRRASSSASSFTNRRR